MKGLLQSLSYIYEVWEAFSLHITAVYLEYLSLSSTAVGSCSDPKHAGLKQSNSDLVTHSQYLVFTIWPVSAL